MANAIAARTSRHHMHDLSRSRDGVSGSGAAVRREAQLVTQDHGQWQPAAFVTGVVYRGSQRDNFYDPGEGVGVLVTVSSEYFLLLPPPAVFRAVPWKETTPS
jgi:hypothetical protein